MKQRCFSAALVAVLCGGCAGDRASLDLAVAGTGIGFGNSRALNGVRLNFRDEAVESVNGLNVTLWDPGKNPDLVLRGIALGLARTDAREAWGLSLGGIAGGDHLYGINLGLLAARGRARLRGLNASGFSTWAGEELSGINAGLMVSGGGAINGLTLGLLYISPEPVTDILEPHSGWMKGINLSGLVIDYPGALGLTAAGIARVRHVRGLCGAWFMCDVREDVHGLCLAPFTYSRRLAGVQLGLLNHVESHPHPFKWLPGINIGFGGPPEEEPAAGG